MNNPFANAAFSMASLTAAINLLPKRAPNEPLNRVTFGVASGGQTQVAADIARRFGPDGNTGIRVNAAARNGGTAVDHEDVQLGLLAVGLDWRLRQGVVVADVGHGKLVPDIARSMLKDQLLLALVQRVREISAD